jgi:ATP phosphoribosyltransferase regulatory subunit
VLGERTLDDIVDGVITAVADARTKPLPTAHATLLERMVAVRGPARDTAKAIADIAGPAKLDLSRALDAYQRRLTLLTEAGVSLDTATFAGDFGRKFEYYTGLVFELQSPGLGRNNPIAGGGRYDGLLQAAGATRPVAAVGASIYTERLLQAQTGFAT